MKNKQMAKWMLMMVLVVTLAMAGCSGQAKNDSASPKKLAVSGISSTSQYLPVYVAHQKGWFKEAGLEVEDVMFTNGPVQMESLSSNSWDIGLTGIGGVLSGTIRYDALLVSASSTDDGGQYVFARKDSPIVAAGQGHNKISSEIYGTVETWKGVKALCSAGTTLQYTLSKTLSGFGLTKEDVNFVAMDGPTIYSSFLAGEGDVCVLGNAAGAFSMLKMSDEYVPISNGRIAQTGLMTNIMANKNSYNDPEKYEAMKIFLQVYFKATKWIGENPEEAAKLMLDFAEDGGSKVDLETCKTLLQADQYYTPESAYKLATEKAEGQDYSVMESKLMGCLEFFIETGNYKEEDKASFLNHTDAKLITDVYNAMK